MPLLTNFKLLVHQISRNSLLCNIHMDDNKSMGTNLPKFILRPSYFEANSLLKSSRLILSVSSLRIYRIDRLLNRLVLIAERSHVLILRATGKDLSGVQEVAGLINIRWTMVRKLGISARLFGCKDSKCSSISEKFVQLLP